MNISTRAKYGLRTMVDIAINQNGRPVMLKGIAMRQGLSEKYLEHIVTLLKVAGYLRSQRGARGGYCLLKEPEEITLGELFAVLEGDVIPLPCLNDANACKRNDICPTIDVWRDLRQAVLDSLNSMTLADLVESARRKSKPGAGAGV